MLAERSGLSVANASQHLQHMRRAGLVAARREGKFGLYRLPTTPFSISCAIRRIAERNLAEVERIVRGYFDLRDSLEPVSRLELMERVEGGSS